jgi:mono/diheme cytochrome c family protein
MRFNVRVVSADAFEQFLASDERTDDLGRITWEGVCAKCHGAKAEGDIGPKLDGSPLMSRRTALTEIIENGTGAMPAVGRGWSDDQLDALLDYVDETYAPEESGGSQG